MTTRHEARSRRVSRRSRRAMVTATVLLGLAGLAGGLSPAVQAASVPAASTLTASTASTAKQSLARAAVPADGGSSVTQTHTWADDSGSSRTGSVTLSQTENLASRQVVDISWNGFLPTVNSEGADSVHQNPQTPRASGYPVVLMECQGDDAAAMTPDDCAITGPVRFLSFAVYDANETKAVQDSSIVDSRSFTQTDGTVDSAPTGQLVELPSDFNDSNVIGTNWYATWTNDDGTHADARFEARSNEEAPQSLGCGNPDTRLKGACSIVVVPVRPMDCIDKKSCPPPNDYLGLSADYKQWQSASNWRNKFVFPITFRPSPDVCKLDSRIPVPTQGSEVLDQAMLSWIPKFCTSSTLFKLGFTRVNDSTARRNLDFTIAGQYATNLAFTTLPALSETGRPVLNAPVAVSGFTVALQLDNAGYEQVDQVNLNARLLAKLVTESYNAPPDPNVADNPQSLFADPEFAKLNPGLADQLQPAVILRNPILVQGSPDLVYEVTRYIAADPEAVAWLKGKPDPWGMKVNPYYQGSKWALPATQFAIQDPYIWKDDTRQCQPKPVMEQVAQFVYDLASAGDAMINRQPQDYSVCQVVGSGGDEYAWAHSARQVLGSRAMLAIMDIPTAEAYQFPMAALQNHAGKFVTPSDQSLASALSVAIRDKATGTVEANLSSNAPGAYPGMMAVYAAAPTFGLGKTLANQLATMIDWLSTTGQTHGDAAGQLPAGYLALPKALRDQAAAVATHVRNQDCAGEVTGDTSCSPAPPTTPPPTTPTTPPATTPHTTFPTGSGPTGQAPTGGSSPTIGDPTTPLSTPSSSPAATSASAQPAVYTSSQRSSLAMHLLPALLIVGLLGLLAAPVLVLLSRPGGGGSPLDRMARRRRTARKPTTPGKPKTPGTGDPS